MQNGDPGSFYKGYVDLYFCGFDLQRADRKKVNEIPGQARTGRANLAYYLHDQRYRLLKPALVKKIGKDYDPQYLDLGRQVVRLILRFQRDLD